MCPHCSYHYPLPSHERVAQLADKGTVTFVGEEVRAVDPLEFFDLRPTRSGSPRHNSRPV